jgi:hypothetical protein
LRKKVVLLRCQEEEVTVMELVESGILQCSVDYVGTDRVQLFDMMSCAFA